MAKWMIIHPNMRWDIIKFEKLEDNRIRIKLLKEKKFIEGKIEAENEFTKVMRVILDEDNKKVHLADFDEIDKFFEENMINFKNRRGLRKEIRRYVEFSLS
jgi:hypothetical protein